MSMLTKLQYWENYAVCWLLSKLPPKWLPWVCPHIFRMERLTRGISTKYRVLVFVGRNNDINVLNSKRGVSLFLVRDGTMWAYRSPLWRLYPAATSATSRVEFKTKEGWKVSDQQPEPIDQIIDDMVRSFLGKKRTEEPPQ